MGKSPLKIKSIKIKDIMPNPYQSRRFFERKSLYELSESIKELSRLLP